MFVVFFVHEAKFVLVEFRPGHAPIAGESDHGHESGEDNPIAGPALRGAEDPVGAPNQRENPLFAEGVVGDLRHFATVGSDKADPSVLFAQGIAGGTDVGVRGADAGRRDTVFVVPFAGNPAKLL